MKELRVLKYMGLWVAWLALASKYEDLIEIKLVYKYVIGRVAS
jgi:hypothetical protein